MKLFWLFIFIFSYNQLSGQAIDSALNEMNEKYPHEKIYIHYDRALYSAGETIRAKAYLFVANDIILLSKTMYADLIDESGKIISHKVAPVLQNSAAFEFEVPKKTEGSFVYVKAYTKWMLNFDSSFLYKKAIPITNNKNELSKTQTNAPKYYLQFFPEGGDLIEGVESRVAFKATDAQGFPININGELFDSKGKITSFKTVHNGMGYITLQPGLNEVYKASWKDPSGKKQETILPAAKKSGIVLRVEQVENKLNFWVLSTAESSADIPGVIIVAQSQHQIYYKAKANLVKSKTVGGYIPLDSIPAGMLQISIFSEDEKPLAERIAFVNQQNYYFITDLNSQLKDLGPRKKNVIQIDVPDTISCNLSIAITDADLDPSKPAAENIFSGILLTSDIKGYVHNPGYYFLNESDSIASHLDLVMMTNGWRRFSWEKILNHQWPIVQYKPESFLRIEGKISGLNETDLGNREIFGIIVTKEGRKEYITIPVKKTGMFSSSELIYYDTAKLFYQFNNDKNKRLTARANFAISNGFLPAPTNKKAGNNWFTIAEKPDSILSGKNLLASRKFLDQFNDAKSKTLETVVIKGKVKSVKEKMNDEYTSGLFSSDNGNTFIMEDDPAAMASFSVLNYLQGRVAGLQINPNGAEPSLSWRGGVPGVYLDELVSDVASIESLPMSDVAMIKVFRPPFLGGFGGSGGAIAVYLKKGAARNAVGKGLDYANVQGYTPFKEFYSPDYSVVDQQSNSADYRTTLYWNPFVLTDKTHRRIKLPFYNNDVTKRYKVVIEGVNAEGKLTRVENVFE